LGKSTGLKRRFSEWAMEIGLEGGYRVQNGSNTPFGWWLADFLFFSNVRQKLGLDQCKLQGSAAAPIAHDTLEFFLRVGIPIYEVYGMSECSGPQTISYPGNYQTGSAGICLSGTELKVFQSDESGNGEICYRGRNVFMGYLHDGVKTREAVDEDGWLHSGDLGKINDKGIQLSPPPNPID
jgi:long-chain-fatty-acid--CoA ligase ACSBG